MLPSYKGSEGRLPLMSLMNYSRINHGLASSISAALFSPGTNSGISSDLFYDVVTEDSEIVLVLLATEFNLVESADFAEVVLVFRTPAFFTETISDSSSS